MCKRQTRPSLDINGERRDGNPETFFPGAEFKVLAFQPSPYVNKEGTEVPANQLYILNHIVSHYQP